MPRLDGSTTLPDGQRLRLRMPHGTDAPRLRALLFDLGLQADDLTVSRALRFDLRDRVAVVATVLADRTEVLVGFAAMDRYGEAPDLVLVDERQAPGARAIVADSLRSYTERARRIA